MSATLVIGLIVVMWLFVLAPLLLRSQRPMSRTNDSFEQTRVVFEGGRDAPPQRARLARARRGVETNLLDDYVDDYDDIYDAAKVQAAGERDVIDNADDVVLEDYEEGLARPNFGFFTGLSSKLGWGSRRAEQVEASVDEADVEQTEADDLDTDFAPVDESLELEKQVDADADAQVGADSDADAEACEDGDVVEPEIFDERDLDLRDDSEAMADTIVIEAQDIYEMDDSFVGPADILDRRAELDDFEADAQAAAAQETGADAAAEYDAVDSDAYAADEVYDDELTHLDPEDLEFAARRRGRGGFDPERDAQIRQSHYQRRQRTVMGLVAFIAVATIAAVVAGGWMWVAPAVGVVVLFSYMSGLRRQVKVEDQLRARRIAHMKRARLGVRTVSDEQYGVPAHLRRRGGVVLQIDDDSPDFVDLEVVDYTFDSGEDITGGQYREQQHAG
ncbi:gephyrin-like molybdotransferase receptor GlpR [Corynebacterium argentoratense]|uniref:divisome protein SepX/GlpR n=1 Tax=Corynebacterium argentoratense TaxID=42817 RepID=UPI001F2ACF35|nr:gephyrin-like molybdotransferase receptor GlpR [Corynebacterium argentoratense]MCF1694513.1 MSCRAMM family adhesin SdrC [Corynebacterium argentoratense]MCF1736123.1 MSCRAMM family adhesin SdrC [Corynebacterium argentoratense]